MTDKLKAQVSAFLDDELLEAESELLVRRLCSDGELRRVAARYTLIGDAVRGSLHEIRADLAGNIMQVIEKESLIEPARRPASNFMPKAVGGGLLAAAVATFAVFSLQPATAPEPDAPIAVVVPEDNDQVMPFQPVTGAAVLQAGSQSQLDRYLLRHNQFATTTGRQGVLTYRFMSVEGDNGGDAGTSLQDSPSSSGSAEETGEARR